MSKIKIALCGCRGHIDKFGRMINSYEESETVAVWDPDYDAAKKVADTVGGCEVFTDFDEMLKMPGLDAVVITFHNIWHKELVLKAAAAKKHIFLEKPLCIELADAYEMRDAVKAAGVKFFLTDPFVNASTTYIKRFIESGKLGRILSVRVRFCNNGAIFRQRTDEYMKLEVDRMGGGMMSDQGGHPLHMIHYLLGKPEKIHAHFAYISDYAKSIGNDEYIAMLMEYPDDVVGIVESGLISAGYTNGVEVCGTLGCIADTGTGDRKSDVRYRITERDPNATTPFGPKDISEWVTVPKDELPPDPDDHIRYFVKMCAYDLPNEGVGIDPASTHGMSLDSAVELMEMREAIYEAAKTGNGVAVK